jgi:KAP family P-loop domain
MSLPTHKAKTLKEAYRICDIKPLEVEDLDRYYVALEARQDAIVNLHSILSLQEPGDYQTILFTGHVGSGKSSELVRVGERWQDEYEVVFVEAEDSTDVNDVEYTDLYLLIIKQVEVALRQHGIKFRSDVLQSFENWFKQITDETEDSIAQSVNVEAEASLGAEAPFIAKLLFKLMANIKASTTDKRTIREVLRQDISRLKTDINALLKDGREKLQAKFPAKKGFLIIVDGLDKCPQDVAERLFFDYAPQLQELHCTIVYTVPIGSLYTSRGIGKSFDDPIIVPMVKVYEFDPGQRERMELPDRVAGLEAMAQMVEQRVEVDLVFSSREQLLNICRLSGGHPRFLMQLVRTACLTGNGRGHTKLLDEDITYAINQLQFRFERELVLVDDAYEVLARTAKQKELTRDQVRAELLFSTALLEYNGDRRWVYPNPAVRRSELYQRAVTALETNG